MYGLPAVVAKTTRSLERISSFGAVVHDHPAGGARLLDVPAEPRRAVEGQVIHADLVERPDRGGQEVVNVAGDQADSDEPELLCARRPRLSQSAADAASAAVLVALMIELSRQANG